MLLPLLALAAALLDQAPGPPRAAAVMVAQADAPAPRLYGVIFEVDTDASGKVVKLVVAKVIDPISGNTDGIEMKVPDAFIASSKVELAKREYPANSHFFTYGFFDPNRPDRADLDPRQGRI